MLQKIISLLLCSCIFICLCACDDDQNDISSSSFETNESSYVDNLVSSNEQIAESSSNEVIEQKKLSDDCDKVLAYGYDGENNYYECVSNEKEDHNGLKITVGIIKNNEWILELTTEMPFLTVKASLYDEKPTTGDVYYIGNGCFLSEKRRHSSGGFGVWYTYIVYNSNTAQYYSVGEAGSELLSCSTDIPQPVDEEYMIINQKARYEGYSVYNILNKLTMKTHEIKIKGYNYSFYNISEGLFAVKFSSANTHPICFYDAFGNKVLDLSQYTIPWSSSEDIYFKNGKCSFEIVNDNDTEYLITVDKTGNVISSEKVD